MASIVEVAQQAGVSRQTVSNVINAPERVAPGTREKVLAAIDDLGYHPNRSARSLRTQRSQLIGIDLAPTVPDEVSPVIDRFIHALSEAAGRFGYHILIVPRSDDPARSHLPLHETRTVDGFVLVDTAPDDRRVQVLTANRVPFVTFGRTGAVPAHDVVDVDNVDGGRQVGRELLAHGSARPAFVGWPEGSLNGDDRLAGFREVWQAERPSTTGFPVLRRLNRVDAGVDAAMSLMQAPDPPDAIVAVSDLLAVGVMRGLRSVGLTPGRDLRVIGFDDAPIAAHLDPPLTTVAQPITEVARRVIDRFRSRLDEPDAPATTDVLAPRLVVRLT